MKAQRAILSWFCSLALLGCASNHAYREGERLLAAGEYQQGLAQLQEAVRQHPGNAQYRITLARQRAAVIGNLLQQAAQARAQQEWARAQSAYQAVEQIEAGNAAARQGLEALRMEQRQQQQVQQAQQLYQTQGARAAAQVREILRLVLLENPRQREALQLKARLAQELPATEQKLAASFRKPVSLELRDAPLRAIFDLLARQSGLNFYFERDVKPDQRASIQLRQVALEDALRMLLSGNQLEMSVVNENTVMIYPASAQKQKEYQQLHVRSFALANGDVKSLAYTIKSLLKARDIVTDERLGLIIMRDTPEMLKMAEKIIALQDLPDPEVMLEVEVLEVKRSRLLELGIRWPDGASLSLAGVPKPNGGNQLLLSDLRHINSNNINLNLGATTINARKEDGDSNILANPRIRVRNKEKARVMIGDRVPVITTTSTATGFVSDSVTYVEVGVKLEVEPNIYLDEEVAIKLNLEVSNLVKEVISKSGTQSYQIGTRNANTVLRLKDGETQILAGLISDEERSSGNRLPGLGELPLLGRLFGSQKDSNERSEIVLAITPHILRSLRRPDALEAEFPSGSETRVGQIGSGLPPLAPRKGAPAAPAATPGAEAGKEAAPAAAEPPPEAAK
ncbi:secretin and TonB N-terminal domain-containing protein [Massilia sp. W12]|uniref:secretin and TonB N-terminal domain-containing protein n=1 Tax=Massilia sp. W12 TaxID=3126507 RepID=UPI0030CD7383